MIQAPAAPPLNGLHHVTLTVTDIQASETWYEKVFGLRRAFVEQHPDGGHTVVMHRPGTALFVGLAHHEANDGRRFSEHCTGLDHFSFAVANREDLDRWLEHLDAHGVSHSGLAEATEPFPYALIVVRDRDNIQLEITWS